MDYGIFQIWHTIKHTILRTARLSSLFVVSTLGANSNYESYLQAHNAYAEGDYAHALELFAKLPETSFAVLYNLGWTWYKNGDAYQGLIYFFKAARLASGLERIQAYAMYEQMQKELGIHKPHNVYYAQLVRYSAYIPDLFLQLATLLLLLLVLCCIYKRKWAYVCVLLACAIGMILCTYKRYQEKNAPIAFAKQESNPLRAGPGEEYGIVSHVPQGTLFTIVSHHDLWYCVAFDHQRGWVSAKDMDRMV